MVSVTTISPVLKQSEIDEAINTTLKMRESCEKQQNPNNLSSATEIKKLPTSTTRQARCLLASPTRRPKRTTRIIETEYGNATITGKIGQNHIDLLEVLMTANIGFRPSEEGHIDILMDPHVIRQKISRGSSKYSHDGLRKLFLDLSSTTIDYIWRDPQTNIVQDDFIGVICERFQQSSVKVPLVTNHAFDNNTERFYYVARLGPAFVRLIKADINLYYDPTPIINNFQHGISQAVARWILTHKPQKKPVGWHIDTLIEKVSGELPYKTLKNRRRELRADKDNFIRIGFQYDEKDIIKGVIEK